MRLTASLVALLIACAGATAAAQGDDEEDPRLHGAAARGLFEEALDAFDAGELEEAERLFRESLDLQWASSAAVNLAEVLVRRGANAEARRLLRRAMEDPNVPPEIRARTRARYEELEARVAWLDLTVPAGASVTLDGEPIEPAELSEPLELDPGEHVLASGDDTQRVALFAGRRRALTFPEDAAGPDEAGEIGEREAERAVEGSLRVPDDGGDEGGGDEGVVIGVAVGVGVAVAIGVAIGIAVAVASSSGGGQLGPPMFEVVP